MYCLFPCPNWPKPGCPYSYCTSVVASCVLRLVPPYRSVFSGFCAFLFARACMSTNLPSLLPTHLLTCTPTSLPIYMYMTCLPHFSTNLPPPHLLYIHTQLPPPYLPYLHIYRPFLPTYPLTWLPTTYFVTNHLLYSLIYQPTVPAHL